ncbi:DM13 domain-containing protein [Streptomyces sp. NPDC048639]|uniref:DM13 domain-containing protein n=1 Tax=Streptomyces sp. NPDC048639 TaxID=3365581 RepID=UPI0037130FC1
MHRLLRLLRNPVVIGVLLLGAAGVGFGLYWFQPWKLATSQTVEEDLPTEIAPRPGEESSRPQRVRTLATGELISHEHRTSGTVKILEGADGDRFLRLENLDTSDGPALHVWLTDAPVKKGEDGWHVFDDGAHEDLGELKGNKGDQNYRIPPGTDLNEYTSVSIWCDRFDVSFGAAELVRS